MENIKIELTKEELKAIIKEAIFEYEEDKKQDKKQAKKQNVIPDGNTAFRNVCKNILNFMNIRCDKSFRHTEANMKIIIDRMKAKELSVCEAIGIINSKADEWLEDEKMNIYLRPATLFNKTNCSNYVGTLKNSYKFDNVQEITLQFIDSELTEEELKRYIRSKNSIIPIEDNNVLL